MFRGTYQHGVDAKGRTSLPAKFREQVAAEGTDQIVMTKGPGGALWCYSPAGFRKIEDKLGSLSPFDTKLQKFRHAFVSPAQECAFDKLGRVLIPQLLRDFAGLDGEVAWVGCGDHIELWNLDKWKKREEEVASVLESDPFAA